MLTCTAGSCPAGFGARSRVPPGSIQSSGPIVKLSHVQEAHGSTVEGGGQALSRVTLPSTQSGAPQGSSLPWVRNCFAITVGPTTTWPDVRLPPQARKSAST
jgi:hypothetical protein